MTTVESDRAPSPTGNPRRRKPQPQIRCGGTGQIELQLMGGFCLRIDRQEIELPGAVQRLTAVLALRGRMSRSRLAGTLWPNAAEARALACLRTGIWRINQIAPQLLLAVGDSLEVDNRVQVDVRDFMDRATAVLRDIDCSAALWPMAAPEEALLADWGDTWLTHDRERLHQLRLHLWEKLSELLAHDGQFGLAVEAALAALRCDVLRESAHRAVIRAHLAEGNVGEARRAYTMCVEVLERELGISPTRETAALLQHAFH